MQTNILWSGIEYYSLENCIVDSVNGITVNSTIVGLYKEQIYRVEYLLKLNQSWETSYCYLEAQFNNDVKKFAFEKTHHKWSLNGAYLATFDGCTDVDISLTPFTNSLPINRLHLNVGQEETIDVIHIDILEDNIKHVQQKYRRLSHDVWKYQNIPTDFEAEIKVDDDGFVIDYPQLFTRTLRVASSYQ